MQRVNTCSRVTSWVKSFFYQTPSLAQEKNITESNSLFQRRDIVQPSNLLASTPVSSFSTSQNFSGRKFLWTAFSAYLLISKVDADEIFLKEGRRLYTIALPYEYNSALDDTAIGFKDTKMVEYCIRVPTLFLPDIFEKMNKCKVTYLPIKSCWEYWEYSFTLKTAEKPNSLEPIKLHIYKPIYLTASSDKEDQIPTKSVINCVRNALKETFPPPTAEETNISNINYKFTGQLIVYEFIMFQILYRYWKWLARRT